MKTSGGQLLESYARLGSFQAVATEFGLSRGGVHLRLRKAGYEPAHRVRLNDAGKAAIEALYTAGFDVNDGQLDALCTQLGHTKPFVCRYAGEAGLTNKGRGGAKWSGPERPPKQPKPYVHPRGMLGKTHSAESKERMAAAALLGIRKPRTDEEKSATALKMMQTKVERYGSVGGANTGAGRSWKAAWRVIGGIRKYFRSRWEANYARVLQWRLEQGMITAWQHEPETFWFLEIKRGVRSYLPDFKVTCPDGRIEYHEVKGWMCDRSRTTLARMAKYHPEITVLVIDKDWFKANKNFKIILKEWE